MSDIQYSNRRRVWLFTYAPLFLWIGLIFYMSSSAGSFEHTSRFIGPTLRLLFPDAPPETIAEYHGYIRKFSHFAVYAVLAILALRAVHARSPKIGPVCRPLIAIAVIAFVAILDEINQSLNAARTGSAVDVMIDVAGGASAAFLGELILRRSASQKSRPS